MSDPLASLLDVSNQLWIACDAEGRVLDANQTGLEFLARSREEVVGGEWAELVGVPFRFETGTETATLSSTNLTLRLWHSIDGERRLTLGRDEKRLQAAEAQVSETLRRLELQKYALDQHAIVAITDRRGRITYANDKFCEISGYARSELIGQDHRIVNSGHHPRSFFKELWRTIAADEVWRGEIRNRAKDGGYYWVDTTIVPVTDADGWIEEFVAIRADITERKAHEASLDLLASLVESSEDAIVRESAAGRITSWNPGAERLYGYTAESVLGRELRDVFQGLPTPTLSQPTPTEQTREAKGGREVNVSETVSPVRRGGQVVAWVRIGRDVSERLNLQERIGQAAKLAALGEMAGNVAHEINNPVGIMSGKARLLLTGRHELTPKVRQELGKIVDQCDRVSRLTRGLLDYCRPSVHPRAPLDPLQALRKALSFARSKAQRAGVSVEEHLLDTSPWVEANAGELEQVFLNLILNAIDAMPTGGRLSLDAALAEREGQDGLLIEVRDTGDGIPDEVLGRIFEPFFTTKGGKGTGLGLAICYGLVTNHGGTIEAQSTVGEGTVFHIWFPAVPREEETS
jgi:PAS domain S-box-containing protein